MMARALKERFVSGYELIHLNPAFSLSLSLSPSFFIKPELPT
jgi:hypothetical protein